YNIAGPEVEEALLRHPDVLVAAVVGRPDERRGEIVVACVVLRDGVPRRRPFPARSRSPTAAWPPSQRAPSR
ncbi:AMP-binding enzyme, partial [Streptomyces roseoverticillatus]